MRKRRSKKPVAQRRNSCKWQVAGLTKTLRKLSKTTIPGYDSNPLYLEERAVLFTAAINLESVLENWKPKPDYKLSDFS